MKLRCNTSKRLTTYVTVVFIFIYLKYLPSIFTILFYSHFSKFSLVKDFQLKNKSSNPCLQTCRG